MGISNNEDAMVLEWIFKMNISHNCDKLVNKQWF